MRRPPCSPRALTCTGREFYEENRLNKLWRRIREEPLIPFGTHPRRDAPLLLELPT